MPNNGIKYGYTFKLGAIIGQTKLSDIIIYSKRFNNNNDKLNAELNLLSIENSFE